MPTRNRREFVRQSIWYFLRQDYPNKELLIVDDGEDGVSDLIPGDRTIRYLRPGAVRTLGAKRNLGCKSSHGDLIAHWDDDDWNDSRRLSTQVSRLLASNADLCAPSSLLHFDPEKGQAFRRQMAGSGALPRGPLLYRRALWERQPFAETNIYEDRPLVRALTPEKILFESDDSYYLKIIHAGSTAPRNVLDPSWRAVPIAEVTRRLNGDAQHYGRIPARDDASRARRISPVCVGAPFAVYDGYGSLSEYVVLALQRAGAQVNIHPFNLDRRGFSAELLEMIDRSSPQPASPSLCFTWPLGDFSSFYPLQDVVISTMWESSQLPEGWAAKINWARAIVVPSRFNADVFGRSGVTRPVEVVPLGVNPAVYSYMERPDRPGITTLTVGTFVPRKNIEVGIAAWKLAFAGNREAKLIIKTRFGVTRYVPDDPRIVFVDSEETTHGIPHWYREADVLMALGNEGFGLPLVEGMATGLPVIALSSEGQGDICEDAKDLVLDVGVARWERFDFPPFGECGIRGVPSVEAVAQRLRWVAEHRTESRQLGKAASEWALRNRSVWSMGSRLLDVFERRSTGKRLLRRSAAIGIANEARWTEFGWAAEDLAAACGQRVYGLDTNQAAAVVHLSYVPSATDEIAFAAAVRAARRRGQPVCVVEYELARAATSWEMDASVLVAHTQEGVAILKQRWPGKRVEYWRLGCPRPAEPAAGNHRTGVAIWSDVPDSFEELAADSVIRMNAAASLEDIRNTLARVAVASLWFQSSPLPRASYLARICLASGIPVLTSPVSQFSDLSNVTYQPASLASGVNHVLQNESLRVSLSNSALAYCQEWGQDHAAKTAAALWQGM